jgi:hypothetical protein
MGNGKINYQAISVSDIDYERLPFGLRDGMRNYLMYGVIPGAFLEAVLENDLVNATGYADGENKRHLCEIVQWCINEIPVVSWGSEDRVRTWVKERAA